ncbi:MAG TPA: 3-oxoacyl-[acyl-carrier-protein] synthase III C-terminal domain-containing protein [Acidimicrobiales bacterium]|nr:3-oxoacyl-[acyl-carrier-protein] synthase III C-terminal domain-containing protein [Acidimicrobiales bacterium]
MATRIEGVSIVTGGLRRRHSALRLAVAAGREAVRKAGLSPGDIDLLLNVGVYRDGNLGEPALAPLIQEDLHANPEDPHPGGRGTFSFDIANGGCGVLSALQVADGFLRAGTARHALVVASDADPGRGMAPDFPFSPAGGALVCRWTSDDRGLAGFGWCNDHDAGKSFRSTVEFQDGANMLTVAEDPVFAARAADAAADAALSVLAEHSLSGADVDIVLASPDRPGFLKVVADRLDLPDKRIVTDGAHFHTAGPMVALRRAERDGRLRPGGTALLVCGGAGVTGGAVLYHL